MYTLVLIGTAMVYGLCDGATFYTCDWITSPNFTCDLFTPEPTCGTNIVTYKNKCEFSRAHCADATIDLRHEGACTDADNPSTPSPVEGAEVVLDFFCSTLSKMDCPSDVSKVCATDGRTYMNYCEYEKERCTHRDLHIQNYGDCVN